MPDFWSYVTDFGDSAVTAPVAAAVAVFLFLLRRRPLFIAWIVTCGGCALTMTALKLAIRGCGRSLDLALTSPSGHAAISAVVYGGLAVLIGIGRPRWTAIAAATAAGSLIAVIAVSRIMVGAHSPAEARLGLLVGTGFAVALGWWARRQARALPIGVPVLALVAIVAALHGFHLPVESLLRAIAIMLPAVLPGCR